jgi:tetratricopeptide (TPR) repeat protein
MSKQRDRGRLLTPEALTKLQQAIRDWEVRHEKKCTQERIRELSGAFKEGGLDPGTIGKIRKGKEGVDPESIRYLFQTFGLSLEESDLVAAIAFTAADPNFVGREGAIADLKALADRPTQVIVIQARGGVGKTTLARKYLQQEFETVLEFPIAKETKDIASIESLIEEKLRQLGEEPGREFLVSIDRLKRKLQSERIGILIDNLEPALDSAGKLIEPHRSYVELLRILADPSVQSVTLITSRERLNEYSVSVQTYLLKELSLDAWKQFFQNQFARAFEEVDNLPLAKLQNAYGGNAKAMSILCGATLTDYSGNIAAYWEENQDDLLIERALEDLVAGQFDRIQQHDPDAYNLLCRMGCYRYQDVPTVPIEGLLCLLWDVAENRQRRVVRALQERSLVEWKDGEFWLHPVIRGEAIGRLRGSENWERANQRAAEFWRQDVTFITEIKDVIRAFEAYYHYVEIRRFEEAGDTILEGRESQSSISERLCYSFYRLGVFQNIIPTITLVINEISSDYHLCGLFDLLGVLYRVLGSIHQAVEFSEKSIKIDRKLSSEKWADGFEVSKVSYWRIHAMFNIGICRLNLWEVEEGIRVFEEIKELDSNYFISVDIFLAFLYSCVEVKEKALTLLLNVDISRQEYEVVTPAYKLIFMGLTYANLSFSDKALECYLQSIHHAENSFHVRAKAVALSGIATIRRECHQYEDSLLYHSEAVELLRSMDAKVNLAEALYQLGLTYRAANTRQKSDAAFQEAIELFTEMEAPKQVERVRRSMENHDL